MNAFEDIVKLYLEEEGYWVRQSVKVHKITKEDKRNLKNPSMPTPEIDIVAYKAKKNELLLVEVKSLLHSYGVHFEAVSGIAQEEGKRYKLFTNDLFRQIITDRLTEEYLQLGLINTTTTIKYALAAGKIHSEWDETNIVKHFSDPKRQWILFSPKQIKDKIKEFANKGWEDNVVIMTAKLTKDAVTYINMQGIKRGKAPFKK
jgi:Holliday junction resolvase-like predicted endonuclease